MSRDDKMREIIRNRLIECRREHNLSQIEVGRIVGKSKNAVGSWEQGLSLPDPWELFGSQSAILLKCFVDKLNCSFDGFESVKLSKPFALSYIYVIATMRADHASDCVSFYYLYCFVHFLTSLVVRCSLTVFIIA